MFVYEPGAGFSGNCTLVQPGDDIFVGKDGRMVTENCHEMLQSQVDVKSDRKLVSNSQVSSRLVLF